MRTISKVSKNIPQIVKALNEGKLVIFPCETVYGIAVDSTNPKAVKKLNTYKARPFGKPYAIMVSNKKMAKNYVKLNKSSEKLYDTFLPGPLTIISKSLGKVALGVESENKTLGVRIPDYPFMIKTIEQFGKPIIATSANASYKKRPYKISDILENLSEKQKNLIGLIIDAGQLPKNEPSTVIDTTLDDPVVLRQGDIKLKDKNEVLSRSPENTKNFAKELWQKYENFAKKRAIVFALEGKMGAGKTVFVKGLAKAMGIDKNVTSPTYDLLNAYGSLTHIDTWRMIKPDEELKNLGTNKLINDKSVIAIEWADKVESQVQKYAQDAVVVWIKFGYPPAQAGTDSENERLISWGVM